MKRKTKRVVASAVVSGLRIALRTAHATTLLLSLVACGLFASCEREKRDFQSTAPPEQSPPNSISDLHPGGGATQTPLAKNSYDENAYAVSQGQQLFTQFNCVGCHAHGGGGMGPALMDEKWIYGSAPQQVFATIVEGRPNGMPSFRGKIVDAQVWQLVAYVRSLGALGTSGAAPARSDHLKGPTPPNSMPAQTPHDSSLPKSAERPQ
jgi:cytochrome c oxidase cbb3-type subunit 3